MSAERLQEHIVELQARIAYQEDTLRALDAAVTEQGGRITQLERRLARLVERLEGVLSVPGQASGDEPPPHY